MFFDIYTIIGKRVLAVPCNVLWIRRQAWLLYQPYTYKKLIVQKLMLFFMRFYADRFFLKSYKKLLRNTNFRFDEWLEVVCNQLNILHAYPVIMWPSQQDRGRVYVYLFDENKKLIAFVKLSLDEINNKSLSKEFDILNSISSSKNKTYHVPVVKYIGSWDGVRYIIMDPLPTNVSQLEATLNNFPKKCVDEFSGIHNVIRYEKFEEIHWWKQFYKVGVNDFPYFVRMLLELVKEGKGLPVCRAHGDLGVHNIAINGDQIWLFDWENSIENAPILTDELIFSLFVFARRYKFFPFLLWKNFFTQYISTTDLVQQRDIMAVLAFRYTFAPALSEKYIYHWNSLIRSGFYD